MERGEEQCLLRKDEGERKISLIKNNTSLYDVPMNKEK